MFYPDHRHSLLDFPRRLPFCHPAYQRSQARVLDFSSTVQISKFSAKIASLFLCTIVLVMHTWRCSISRLRRGIYAHCLSHRAANGRLSHLLVGVRATVCSLQAATLFEKFYVASSGVYPSSWNGESFRRSHAKFCSRNVRSHTSTMFTWVRLLLVYSTLQGYLEQRRLPQLQQPPREHQHQHEQQ